MSATAAPSAASLSAAAAFDGSSAPRLTSVPAPSPGPVAGGPRHDLTELPDGIEVQRAVSKGRRCLVTRDEFHRDAATLTLAIGGSGLVAEPKEFSTGSVGWWLNGKASIAVGERMVAVQISGQMVAVGTKGKDNTALFAAMKPFSVGIGPVAAAQNMMGAARDYEKTGSFGWYVNGKAVVMVGNEVVTVQVGVNAVVVGSKDAD